MATVQEDLFALLMADTALVALIGDRLFPVYLPQDQTLPALVYLVVTMPQTYSHSGSSNLARASIQFDAYAETYAGAQAVISALRAVCERWPAAYGGGALVQNQRDRPFYTAAEVFGISTDIAFWHKDRG